MRKLARGLLGGLSLGSLSLLAALGFASASRAQQYYSVSGGGGQLQIGDGLPIPIQAQITAMGGAMSTGGPIGTGANFPDKLLIPPNTIPAKRLIKQTAGPDPKKMIIPPGVFRRKAPGPVVIGVAPYNPKLFQVKTNLSLTAPGFGTATFKAGGRTGAATATFSGTPTGSIARYSKMAAQFGGPSVTKLVALTPVRVWVRGPGAKAPCKNPAFLGVDTACLAVLARAFPGSKVAAGGIAGNVQTTPGGPAAMTPFGVAASVNTMGTLGMSASVAKSGVQTNKATSVGFPWTTGRVTLSQPTAFGMAEKFILSGMDGRVGGVGTISLVSGALSNRVLTGPNSNRGWARYTLPEPAPMLGTATALAMLAICHRLVRRR